jgi:multiple sugar transport system permease protein
VRRRLRDLAVLVLLAGYAVPYFWQMLTSLKPEAELLSLPPVLPSRFTWEHYQVVLEQSLIPRALVNSLGVACLTTVLAVALGGLAAYALARLPVPGKGMILLGIVAGSAFPQIATVSPLYLLMRALGLRDTWTALVLANTSFALPLVIWLLAGFIREIPEELEQAAALDGARRRDVFRFILLPLVAPGMASAALLTFLFSWNEFLFAYTFTATEASRTVPVALALFPVFFEVPWGDIAAASILASLPPILLVAALQRYLIRGLLAGALRE